MTEEEYLVLSTLPNYWLEIGVFVDGSDRPKEVKIKGITNAELMYIHENGSPINHIPARPVLDMTIDYASKNLYDKAVSKAIREYVASGNIADFERPLKIMAKRMESYAREIIYSNDGRLKANAPSTIKAKGYNHPLFQTSQLVNSIRCELKHS